PAPAEAAVTAPASAPALVEQMRAPVAAIRALPEGTHVVTVHVTPDELGPVTVRAVVTDGALDVQLTVSTDAARDALRAILPDLRRDLSSGGAPAQLQLADAASDGPAADRGSTERQAERGTDGRTRGGRADSGTSSAEPAAASRPVLAPGHTALDVLA
ncbi:flagellar hook-length control protein FliK, partial [Pseudolysinimonas sp.]|uniref:flagellar hook-length control protein FliK n=1 Tax=Pseudolysinimonas sp. TaxID=2680009 RepID=UPI0037835578